METDSVWTWLETSDQDFTQLHFRSCIFDCNNANGFLTEMMSLFHQHHGCCSNKIARKKIKGHFLAKKCKN